MPKVRVAIISCNLCPADVQAGSLNDVTGLAKTLGWRLLRGDYCPAHTDDEVAAREQLEPPLPQREDVRIYREPTD